MRINNTLWTVDVCVERELLMVNTFQHKVILRHMWAKGNERSMIDCITVDNKLKKEVQVHSLFRECSVVLTTL